MAKPKAKASRGSRPSAKSQNQHPAQDWRSQLIVAGANSFGKVVQQIGTSAVVLGLLLFVVHQFGTSKTKDDFLRAVLFGETNNHPLLSIFFGLLALIAIFGGKLRHSDKKIERGEIKRLREENERLQAQLLGGQGSHQNPVVHIQLQPPQLASVNVGTNLPPANVEGVDLAPKAANGRVGGVK